MKLKDTKSANPLAKNEAVTTVPKVQELVFVRSITYEMNTASAFQLKMSAVSVKRKYLTKLNYWFFKL